MRNNGDSDGLLELVPATKSRDKQQGHLFLQSNKER